MSHIRDAGAPLQNNSDPLTSKRRGVVDVWGRLLGRRRIPPCDKWRLDNQDTPHILTLRSHLSVDCIVENLVFSRCRDLQSPG